MIAIIDYKAGNIGSIKNMLKKIGHDSIVTSSPDVVEKASKIILPGVGAFDYGMDNLNTLGLIPALERKKKEKTPILGICLGAQLMCYGSDEGKLNGLGWISGRVHRFPNQQNGRKVLVPHMGWDEVEFKKTSPISRDLPPNSRFYFVHSYYIKCTDESDQLLQNYYSVFFDSAFEKENILGVQFHPEKSHKFGKQLLKNFIERY